MFKYQNTVIVNSAYDSNGTTAKFEKLDSGALRVTRVGIFKKVDVVSLYHRAYEAAVKPKAEIDLSSLVGKAGLYRTIIYIGLEDSQDSAYANVWVLKGKPLAYEFEVKAADTAATIAANAAKAIKKIQTMFGDIYITASVDGTKLVINGLDGHQVFRTVKIQKLNEEKNSALIGAEFEDTDIEAEVTANNPGFGTWEQLTKNLHLPTAENVRIGAINSEELPVMGAEYDQYIITICKDRGIMGGSAVGEPVKSITTHVFWIPSGLKSQWEAATAGLGTFEEYNAEYKEALGAVDDASDDKPGVATEGTISKKIWDTIE